MKDKQFFQIHSDICHALTHPIRLEIIDSLLGGEKNVTQLVEALQATQGTVSRHLSFMRAKGVVVSRRVGTSVYYQLGSPRISAAYDEMHQFVVEHITSQSKMISGER
jgi:ArsR family transcriptional regulator